MMPNTTAVVLASLLDWLVKGFLILGFAFLADMLMRRANPSLRHWMWVVALAAGILLPWISYLVPSFNQPLFHLNFLAVNPAPEPGAAAGTEGGLGWSSPGILLGTYVAGAVLVLVWQLVGRAYVLRLRNNATEITDPRAVGELGRLRAALGIRIPVDLLASDLISIPFSAGYFRPVIVVPRATSLWPLPVLASVLIHELAHIKRKDILTRIVAQVACCVHWMDPLAWYGLGRIIMEQEIACDHQVLGAGTKPSDYARNLLALAKAGRGRFDFALTSLARRMELRSRLLEILQPTRSRIPLRIGESVLFFALTLALVLPVSALHIWDASDRDALAAPSSSQPQSVSTSLPALVIQPFTTPSALPDIEAVKQKLTAKLKDMKAQELPQEQIDRFAAEAKAKIANLQNEKKKQDEKNQQIELQRLRNAKGVK